MPSNLRTKAFLLRSCLGIIALMVLSTTNVSAQDESASFLEISIGTRSFSEVPGDIFIIRDSTTTDNLDFGKGSPLSASVGFVFLPNEPGWAGKFSVDGYLGNVSGFGFDLGAGYKFGNERFSFAPMLSFSINRMFNSIDSYNIDSTLVPASLYDPGSDAVYIGSGVDLHGGSGRNINYNMNYAIFDFRLTAYLAYRISDQISAMGRISYNLNVGKSTARYEVTGRGYDSFDEFLVAAEAEANGTAGEAPALITTEVSSDDFMQQDGQPIDKVPVNFSGLQIQLGIGINL